MDQLGPVGTAITERLGIAGDQQHLDIAAGTGEPGLTVARLAPMAAALSWHPADGGSPAGIALAGLAFYPGPVR